MKWSKTTKSILAISSATILTLPALTLCGCSNISQYCIPVVTDGNPYYVGTTGIQDPYRLAGNGYYNSPEPDTSKEASAYQIPTTYLQLPASYIYTSEYNSNFEQTIKGMYGYCNFNKPEWKEKGPEGTTGLNEQYQFNRRDDYDWEWKGVANEDLQYISNGALSSYQNLNISNAITSVNIVTNSFLEDFNYMNMFLNIVVGQKKEEDIKNYLSYLLSGKVNNFTYGANESVDKDSFYQYFLDNSNLISVAASKYKFGPYNVGWTFKDISGLDDSIVGSVGESTNPFLQLEMKDLSKYEYGFEGKSGTNTPVDKTQSYKFPLNINFTGSYLWDGKDTKNPEYKYTVGTNPYLKYTYDKDKKISDFGSIVNIPMLVSPKHVQSAYYDPSKNLQDAIQPAEWLTKNTETNLKDLNKAINDEGLWTDVRNNVNLPDLKVTTLTYDQNSSYAANDLEYANTANVDNIYSSWMSDEVKTAYNENKMDPRVHSWIENGQINFGDWVALANYATFVVNFQYKYKEGDVEKTQCIKALLPYFSGFSNVFPAYMLFTNADCYKEINKDALDESQGKGKYYIEYVGSGIETDVKNTTSTLTDHILPDTTKTYSTTAEMFKNTKYMPYIWTFGRLGTKGVDESTGLITNPAQYYDYVNNIGSIDYSAILKNADPEI